MADDDNSSFGAPENFHIAVENEDDRSHWDSHKVRCPLCNYTRKSFYCQYCIRDGNFTHTTHHLPERFNEKQLKHKNLKSVHRAQQTTCIQLLHKRQLAEDLQFAIKQKRENISVLRKSINERAANTKKLREKTQQLTKANQNSRKQVPQYVAKCQQFADYIEKTDERNDKLNCDRHKLYEQLKQCRVQNIMKLIKFIFPLSQRISKGEPIVVPSSAISDGSGGGGGSAETKGSNAGDLDSSSENSETINALAEAAHEAYVRGRWILQDSHGEKQHVIVAPSLPDDGDYSAYNDWVATTKDGVPNAPGASETLTSINAAYRISAALTYTTQLTHLLSYYLDMRMPFKINYSDFCKKELTEQSFARKVARLNANILYLCYTQRVKLSKLSPTHTLENIEKLLNLDYSDLGYIGAVDVSDSFSSMDILSFQQDLSPAGDSGSEEDENALPTEWENVQQPPEIIFPTQLQNAQQSASIAGGLVTSAVQSVASIWRVFTTGK